MLVLCLYMLVLCYNNMLVLCLYCACTVLVLCLYCACTVLVLCLLLLALLHVSAGMHVATCLWLYGCCYMSLVVTCFCLSVQLRVKCLVSLAQMLDILDKHIVLDHILPILHQIPSREPGVLMAVLGVLRCIQLVEILFL